MISYADLKALEGFPVRIEYETARKAIRSRSGTLRSIGISNVSIESLSVSGFCYAIPKRSGKTITELKI